MPTVQSNTERSSGFRDWAYFVPFCVALLAVLLGIGRPRPKNPPETLDIDKLPPELRRVWDRHVEREREEERRIEATERATEPGDSTARRSDIRRR